MKTSSGPSSGAAAVVTVVPGGGGRAYDHVYGALKVIYTFI
jgi:hypothetical protein